MIFFKKKTEKQNNLMDEEKNVEHVKPEIGEFEDIDDDNNCWVMSYKLKEYWNLDKIQPLVSMAFYLMKKGFEFKNVSIGGGIDEVNHGGVFAYRKKYYDLDDFRNNFRSDIAKEEETYSGWAKADYNYISEMLVRDDECVEIEFFRLEEYKIRFNEEMSKNDELMLDIGNKMLEILGDDIEFSKEKWSSVPDYFS